MKEDQLGSVPDCCLFNFDLLCKGKSRYQIYTGSECSNSSESKQWYWCWTMLNDPFSIPSDSLSFSSEYRCWEIKMHFFKSMFAGLRFFLRYKTIIFGGSHIKKGHYGIPADGQSVHSRIMQKVKRISNWRYGHRSATLSMLQNYFLIRISQINNLRRGN